MSVFSERLRLVMSERHITQSQLCTMTGIPKSAMNQYLSDRFKPRRERTYTLCKALNVNPAWLMGLDEQRSAFSAANISIRLTEEEQRLIMAYRTSDEVHKKINELLSSSADSESVFRAAKSRGGTIPPACESMASERIEILLNAPETDDEL